MHSAENSWMCCGTPLCRVFLLFGGVDHGTVKGGGGGGGELRKKIGGGVNCGIDEKCQGVETEKKWSSCGL